MDALAERTEHRLPLLAWLREFFKEELTPYPGRGMIVARMVIASTLVMVIAMTFRLPFGVQAIFALVISRESSWATVSAVKTAILTFVMAAGYVVMGTMLFLDDPMLRTLWVIASLFLAFYLISIMANYGGALGLGIMLGLSVPVLDQHISTEVKVHEVLWGAGQTILAAILAALAAIVFAELEPGDPLVRSINERLAGVEDVLNCYAAGVPVRETAVKKIIRLAMLGTSPLRQVIRRSNYSPQHAEQMSAGVALVGRLVDMTANLGSLSLRVSQEDRDRSRILAGKIGSLRAILAGGEVSRLSEVPVDTDVQVSGTMPPLPEMEKTCSLIAEVLKGTQLPSVYGSPAVNEGNPSPSLFVRDAFTNPEHIQFGLKGCLAASLCYIIYTALNWNGISTAVLTCLLTALTTIGASRQKQILRFTGALVGGAMGLGAQIFLLPSVDSIAGFTLLFLVVTLVSAWIATSGPRLSYFGVQMALAYYVINLQGFGIETSLVPGRDRVVGILLGLVMMWLVFDQLWSVPTVIHLKKTFISLFRLVAQLIGEPLNGDQRTAIDHSYSLRETISGGFNQIRALADAMWFEFGPARQQNLAQRSQILGEQGQLQMLFIGCVTLLKYRLGFPGFELPEPVRVARSEFEESLADSLNGMADHLEGRTGGETQRLEVALIRLKESVRIFGSDETKGLLTANMETVLSLSEKITGLMVSLSKNLPFPQPAVHGGS